MVSAYKIFSIAICLLAIFQIESNALSPRNHISKLINLMSQKYSGNKPLVLILEPGSRTNEAQVHHDTSSSSDFSDEANKLPLMLKHYKGRELLPIKKSTTRSYIQIKKDNQLHRLQRLRDSRDRKEKDTLRSPIIKKLLRISNRIQCNAKDQCQDKCNDRYRGPKAVKCSVKCEVQYDCEEEEKDPCEDDACADSCGNSDECMMSTRGERLVTKETKCKRC